MKKIFFSLFLLFGIISFSNFTSKGGSMYCLKIGKITELNAGDHSFKAGLCRITTTSNEKVVKNVTVIQKGGYIADGNVDFEDRLVYGIAYNYLKYNSKSNKLFAYVFDPYNPNIKVITSNFLTPAENIEDYTDILSYGFNYNTFVSDYNSVY